MQAIYEIRINSDQVNLTGHQKVIARFLCPASATKCKDYLINSGVLLVDKQPFLA